MTKLAFFRFEASQDIGAGHAIRSCVIADALKEHNWHCKIVTTQCSYDFIPQLTRFERVNPDELDQGKLNCDLLVVDSYAIDKIHETCFRAFAKHILVIDDLANRQHDCDILIDQTYGRDVIDYKQLAPESCAILTGSDYTLIRKDFTNLRPRALDKRIKAKEVKRILVSLGGSDPENYTIKVLDIIQNSEFKGSVDIVLGFSGQNNKAVQDKINQMTNDCLIHINPDMSELMYNADLAIGASGSSMWERCVLGLPTMMFTLSYDQDLIAKNLHELGSAVFAGNIEEVKICGPARVLNTLINDMTNIKLLQEKSFSVCDGTGIKLILGEINGLH